MAGSQYLQGSDVQLISPGASLQQIVAASSLIDVYLKRAEGLICDNDATGAPAWMDALTPSATLTLGSAIEPGQNVATTLGASTLNLGGMISVGEVFIADRTNPAIAEPLVVSSLPGGNQVQFQNVVFAHAQNAPCDLGMTIKQHKFMPDGRPLTTLAYTPIARLLSGQGRYGYGRRSAASRYMVDDYNLLASLTHFGGPPAWEFFPLQNTGVNNYTGEVWVPAGVMLAYYSEVNVWYVAGFPYSGLPPEIKYACGQVIAAMAQNPVLGNVKTVKAGNTSLSYFSASNLNDDIKALLNPYRAKLYV